MAGDEIMSSEIRSYTFDKAGLNQVRQAPRGKNWPVVYLIHDDNNLYIGETTSASTRMDQHLKNEAKKEVFTLVIWLAKISASSVYSRSS